MKWEGDRQSDNVEDRRDEGGGGGGGGFGLGGRSIGIGSIAIALVAGWVFGINPLTVLGLLGGGAQQTPSVQSAPSPARPESFTHGSSAQRVNWFKRGVAAGRMADCNTFEARPL